MRQSHHSFYLLVFRSTISYIAEIAVRAAPAALLADIAGAFFKARYRGFSFSSSSLMLATQSIEAFDRSIDISALLMLTIDSRILNFSHKTAISYLQVTAG